MKKLILFLLTILSVQFLVKAQQEPVHKFAPLPYAYDALEPYIDKMTMEIHYDRHHRAYYNNFMAAIKDSDLEKMSLESIFASIGSFSPAIRRASSRNTPTASG